MNKTGVASLLIKKFNPIQLSEISQVIETSLLDVVLPGVKSAIEEKEIWIDFRCTPDQYQLIKAELEKNLKKFCIDLTVIFNET